MWEEKVLVSFRVIFFSLPFYALLVSQNSKIPCILDVLHMLPIYSKTELRTVCPSCKFAEGFVTFNAL